jgi:hypothetical protein
MTAQLQIFNEAKIVNLTNLRIRAELLKIRVVL